VLSALATPLAGCLGPGSGSESGSEIEWVPMPDPNTFSCNSFEESGGGQGRTQGVVGELAYLANGMPRYKKASEFFEFGVRVPDLLLFLNQIFIPTRPFDRGFSTQAGETIRTLEGDTLYEYFALRLRGRLQLGGRAPGDYQFALLSDDGANLMMDFGSGLQVVVANDGDHPTRMGCGPGVVSIRAEDKIPFQVDYYQGPRFHIALMVLARPYVPGPLDVECGRSGNSRYFDSTQNPPAPQPAYNDLLSRGWFPLEPENYLLPEEHFVNPCNEPAPNLSNIVVQAITSTSITMRWQTDRPADSRSFFRRSIDPEYTVGPSSSAFVVDHEVVITGLTPNTVYQVAVRSGSASGLTTDSSPFTVRTRR